jgi:hypothetical protein
MHRDFRDGGGGGANAKQRDMRFDLRETVTTMRCEAMSDYEKFSSSRPVSQSQAMFLGA